MIEPDTSRHYRRNFLSWVVETSTWMFAGALLDSTTILPALSETLTGVPFFATLFVSIRYAGQGWPQLIAASLVSGTAHRRAFFFRAVIPGRLLLLWPCLLLLFGITKPALVLPALLIAYSALWISEGLSIVPWVDMVGKTIPARRRGRLFAAMHLVGGLLTITAGLVARQALPHLPFPVGYGLLFTLALAALVVSTGALVFLHEPPSPAHEEVYSTRALIRDIPNLLRTDTALRRLVILQALFGFSVLPAPLYILFAGQHVLAATGVRDVGIFLVLQAVGATVGNLLLGHIGDRFGYRLLLRTLAAGHALVPLTALLASSIALRLPVMLLPEAFGVTFFAYGALSTGTWMAITNYLLEIAPEHDRPAYIAVANALNITAIILPLLGGLLVGVIGYPAIFITASIVLTAASFLAVGLHEPRLAMHPPNPATPHQDLGAIEQDEAA